MLQTQWLKLALLGLLAVVPSPALSSGCSQYQGSTLAQVLRLLPRGGTTCRGCSLDSRRCRLSCQSCTIPGTSRRGPTTTLNLASCPGPRQVHISLTSRGLLQCRSQPSASPPFLAAGTPPPPLADPTNTPVPNGTPAPADISTNPLTYCTFNASDPTRCFLQGEIRVLMGHAEGNGTSSDERETAPNFDAYVVPVVGNVAGNVVAAETVRIPLNFSYQLSARNKTLQTGMSINLPLRLTTPSAPGSRHLLSPGTQFNVDEDEVQPELTGAVKDFVVGGVPVSLTTLTVIFTNFCNRVPTVTPDVVRQLYYNRFANGGRTLENLFNVCSHNKLRFVEAGSHIITVSSRVPCTGTFPRWVQGSNGVWVATREMIPYNMRVCDWSYHDVTYSMAMAAMMQQLPGVNYNSIKRVIMLIPPELSGNAGQPALDRSCGYAGLGMMGGHRRPLWQSWVWTFRGINNTRMPPRQQNPLPQIHAPIVDHYTLFQEIMHNTGLWHSNRMTPDGRSLEYGDRLCPLGGVDGYDVLNTSPAAQGIACPNAAQAYKAGWVNVSAEYVVASPPVALAAQQQRLLMYTPVRLTVSTPRVVPNGAAAVRLVLGPRSFANWMGDGIELQRSIFISFRSKAPGQLYDSGIPEKWNHRVYVHEFWGIAQPLQDPCGCPIGVYGLRTHGPGINTYGCPTHLQAIMTAPAELRDLRRIPDNNANHRIYNFPGEEMNITNTWVLVASPAVVDPALTRSNLLYADAGNIRITVNSVGADAANVTVCRFYNRTNVNTDGATFRPDGSVAEAPAVASPLARTLCTDGKDNDCDGFADSLDCACQALFPDLFNPTDRCLTLVPSPPPPRRVGHH